MLEKYRNLKRNEYVDLITDVWGQPVIAKSLNNSQFRNIRLCKNEQSGEMVCQVKQ